MGAIDRISSLYLFKIYRVVKICENVYRYLFSSLIIGSIFLVFILNCATQRFYLIAPDAESLIIENKTIDTSLLYNRIFKLNGKYDKNKRDDKIPLSPLFNFENDETNVIWISSQQVEEVFLIKNSTDKKLSVKEIFVTYWTFWGGLLCIDLLLSFVVDNVKKLLIEKLKGIDEVDDNDISTKLTAAIIFKIFRPDVDNVAGILRDLLIGVLVFIICYYLLQLQ